jgi:hypothetical protein
MSEKRSTDDGIWDLWLSIVESKYPKMPIQEAINLRVIGASDWCFGIESESATLFEQFVMMRHLKELRYEDEE